MTAHHHDDDKSPLQERAEELLETLEGDHRYCANCFRKIREVEPPGMRSGGKQPPECAIGFAYTTPFTVDGIVERYPYDEDDEDDDAPPSPFDPTYPPIDVFYSTRAICECGATHHRTQRPHMGKDRLKQKALRLCDAIDDLRREYRMGSAAKAHKAEQYEYSRDALLRSLLNLKSKPELQYRDHDLLERSLKLALKHSSYDASRGASDRPPD